MSSSNASRNDRLAARRFRAPVVLTGAALLGMSLLLSVGPALAANNNSNSNANGNGNGGGVATNGTLKVHDATTGVEADGNGNDPHVCDFWLSFSLDAPFEAGTWTVVSWAPTGDGSTVESGVYDTSGDGIDGSSVIDLPAGHYRVEWAASGPSVSSKKTFWVDADCDEPATPEDEPPAEEPPADQPPADEPPAEEPGSPTEESDPESPVDEAGSPSEESVVTDEELPADEPDSPSDESVPADGESLIEEPAGPADESPDEDSGSPSDESVLGDTQSLVEDLGPGHEPVNEGPVTEDPGSPADDSPATPDDPSDEGQPAQAADPDAPDSSAPAMDNQLAGTGTSDQPTMSDTAAATLPVPSGVAATFAVLMLIVVHATARRGKRGDTRANRPASTVGIRLP